MGRFAAMDSAGFTLETLGHESRVTTKDYYTLLLPYFWPKDRWERVSAMSCFALLGLSKACGVASPAFLGRATDQLLRGNMPIFDLLMFGALRFGVSGFEEAQKLVYLRTKEVAYHEIACRVFVHLHQLSLHWHISKRSGVVLRAMDRGISSASTVVDMLFLRLVPTLIEMGVLVAIFTGSYNSPNASVVLAVGFATYVGVTVCLTRWRRKARMKQHRTDNEANSIAVESLSSFETVKAFNNEQYELGRYSAAVRDYQRATRTSAAAVSILNILQSGVIRATVTGVLLVAALDVLSGRTTIGDFVALQVYVVSLFTPLSWLGSMFSLIIQSVTDMRNLVDLLLETAEPRDAPNATALVLRNPSQGATIEFRHVTFSYPSSSGAANRIEAQMERQKQAELQGGALSLHRIRQASTKLVGAVLPETVRRSYANLGSPTDSHSSGSGANGAGTSTPIPATGPGSATSTVAAAATLANMPTDSYWHTGADSSSSSGGVVPKSGASSSSSSAHVAIEMTGAGGRRAGGPLAATDGLAKRSPSPSTAAAGGSSSSEGPLSSSLMLTGAGGPPRIVLRDVSFTMRPGTTTALVGHTGSGKSSIARLLFRFYDLQGEPQSSSSSSAVGSSVTTSAVSHGGGAVLIDGQDVRSVTQSSLRSAIGIVPQDTVLFNDSLAYNIKYGRPGASDEDMIAAANAAQLSDFVATLPEGYNTKVGERGLKLSGGEKQRVAIARAILKNPPILILDEASSALDSITEAAVVSAISSLRAGRTVLVIAHRLSTIKDADEILVLSEGAVIERGTHEGLLASGGRYAEMWHQQSAELRKAAGEVLDSHAGAAPTAASSGSPGHCQASESASTPIATMAAANVNGRHAH